MSLIFTTALFAGAAAIAAWIAVRFPKLAPRSVFVRALGGLFAVALLSYAPVDSSTSAALYTTLFVVLLPLLTITWLLAFWVLQALGNLSTGR
ncbi:MAG: hypothetical protein ACJ76I_02310 [Gaiellaceae bacterium]